VRAPLESVWIAGVGMTALGRHLDRSVKDLTREAVDRALDDAQASLTQINAAWFSNTRQGIFEWQHGIRGQCALRSLGLERVPIFNTDNACASSSSGLNLAIAYLRAGMADVALVVGAEKMNYPDKRDLMFQAFHGSIDRELGEAQLRAVIALSADLPLPPGATEPTGERSIFMDSYSAAARFHMHRYGSTPRQMAAVAAKNHWHSQWNPLAQYRHPMTIDEVLADRVVSWPLTRSMCAPMSDGAAALVVCNRDGLERLARQSGVEGGPVRERAVRVIASSIASGVTREPEDSSRYIGRLAAQAAYEEAGIGPEDLSLAEVHDASAFAEIKQVENLGLAAAGEGGFLAERGDTRLGGRIPVNTSGGLLSKGHPIAATGAIQIVELVMQLRGEAGARQVAGASIAAASNGGGFWGGEEAVAAVTLLARAG
jgi:acetyl-CoA acyltransferase